MSHHRFVNVERILVRSANWVGDAIMTTPALHAIRKNFPHAHITLLAKPWVVPVFENSPDIDEIMIYATQDRHSGLAGLWRLATDIRKRRFDLAILFQNAFEAALLAFLAGIPHRVGFTTDARTALLNHRVRSWRPLKRGHLVDYYLGLVSGAGLALHGRRLTLFLSDAEINAARRLLKQKLPSAGRLLIGLNPGATFGTAKRWLPERYTLLGQRLIRELDAGILIFGGPDEADLGQHLATEIGQGCIDLSGQTTLRRAMALIGQCDLFITNDSGLMHVAAALNRLQVVVIGPTDPRATGPCNSNSRLVQVKEACYLSPCLKPHCPIVDHRCMTAVSEEMVFAEALTLLKISQERT